MNRRSVAILVGAVLVYVLVHLAVGSLVGWP